MKLRKLSLGGSTDLGIWHNIWQGVGITQNWRVEQKHGERYRSFIRVKVKYSLENHNFYIPSLLIPNSRALIYNVLIRPIRVALHGATHTVVDIKWVITENLLKFCHLIHWDFTLQTCPQIQSLPQPLPTIKVKNTLENW